MELVAGAAFTGDVPAELSDAAGVSGVGWDRLRQADAKDSVVIKTKIKKGFMDSKGTRVTVAEGCGPTVARRC